MSDIFKYYCVRSLVTSFAVWSVAVSMNRCIGDLHRTGEHKWRENVWRVDVNYGRTKKTVTQSCLNSAQHTPILTWCHDSLWMNMGFSVDKDQLFRNFTYILIRNEALFVAKQNRCGVCFFSSIPWWILRAGTACKIHSCFTTCVVACVNFSCLTWM